MELADQNTVSRLRRQQSALASFGSYALREPVLLTLLSEAARVCADGLGAALCKICQYRKSENDLLVIAGHGWREGVIDQVISEANHTSPQGRAYVTEQPVIIENLSDAKNFAFAPFYAEYKIVSSIDVIIKGTRGPPFGVLEVDSVVQHKYDQHDVAFLTGFANVVAEAVATAARIDEMKALVVEKDVLAEELKHRVRNNLHLVNGMLTRHQSLASGREEKASIAAIMRRVMTLAEIYDQLVGSGFRRTIDLGDYLRALCRSLPGLQREGINSGNVNLTCSAEPLLVGLDTVGAMGMVVAELVSNCYEHAAAKADIAVQVILRRSTTSAAAVLIVQDNGSGFTEPAASKRYGIGLVRRLVEQVHGTAEFDTTNGAMWTLRFPLGNPVQQDVSATGL